MRLGTRWPAGTPAPAAVPEDLRRAVRAAESGATAIDGQFWTLTWLEGLAIAELDDGTRVRQRPGGQEPSLDPARADEGDDDAW